MSVPLEGSWVPASPGVWDRVVNGDTWTLSARSVGPWTSYTLTGPHPTPTWTISDRDTQDPEGMMSLADDRIRRHYAVH